MDLSEQLEHFRKDHDSILRFLNRWERALSRAADDDEEVRRNAVYELRGMSETIRGFAQHCREEEQSADLLFRPYLDERSIEVLRWEHEKLARISTAYSAELEAVSARSSTADLVEMGRQLIAQLRHHIAFEEGLLKQVEEAAQRESHPVARDF